jgi:peptide/nickel transport system substrate-binding protein
LIKIKKTLAIILCLAMLLTLLTGCGGNAGNETGSNGNQEAEVRKDRLIIARPIDTDNMDPVTNQYTEDSSVIENIADGLVTYNDDGTEIIPRLATDWETSEDGLTWTFNLRKGLKFSDGSPVTAEDIEFSFQRAIDHTESIYYTYAASIESVECPDDTTVIFKMKNQDPTFLTSLSMCNMKIISKAYFDANGGEEGVANGIMGTGPYAIGEWKKGESLLLVANEHHWEEGFPKLKEIELKVVPEAETRNLMLKAGEVDLINEVPFRSMADLDAIEGITAKSLTGTQTKYFIINHRKEPFGDVRVREAFRYAINIPEIIDIVMLGNAEVATSYINKNALFFNEEIPAPKRDVAKAKQLLAEAGYPDGFEFEYLIVSGDAEQEQIATVAKQQLAEAGIKANIVVEENASFREKFSNNGVTVYVGQWTLDTNDPAGISDYWWIYEQADAYMSGYKNPRLTEINQLAKTEMDPEIRGSYFKEMQQTFYDDVVAIPIYWKGIPVAYKDNVKNYVQLPYRWYRFKYCTIE